jgi:hypothetical protein
MFLHIQEFGRKAISLSLACSGNPLFAMIANQLSSSTLRAQTGGSCSNNQSYSKPDEASMNELELFLSQFASSNLLSQTVHMPTINLDAGLGLGKLPPPSRYVRQTKKHSQQSNVVPQPSDTIQQSNAPM